MQCWGKSCQSDTAEQVGSGDKKPKGTVWALMQSSGTKMLQFGTNKWEPLHMHSGRKQWNKDKWGTGELNIPCCPLLEGSH